VVLAAQARCEFSWRAVHDVDPTGITGGQRITTMQQVQRRAPRGAGLREHQRAAAEFEDGQRGLAGRWLRARRKPLQAAGNHRVQHQKQLAIERNDDQLAESLGAHHATLFGRGNRWYRRAQQEGTENVQLPQHVAPDLGGQAFDIDRDVGQLGHRQRASIAGSAKRRAAAPAQGLATASLGNMISPCDSNLAAATSGPLSLPRST
jgi:hypothetical protein